MLKVEALDSCSLDSVFSSGLKICHGLARVEDILSIVDTVELSLELDCFR